MAFRPFTLICGLALLASCAGLPVDDEQKEDAVLSVINQAAQNQVEEQIQEEESTKEGTGSTRALCYIKMSGPGSTMRDVGQGFCRNGYLRGWDRKGIRSQADCNAVCISERDCTYVAWYKDHTCSRYGDTSCNLNGDRNHRVFKKESRCTDLPANTWFKDKDRGGPTHPLNLHECNNRRHQWNSHCGVDSAQFKLPGIFEPGQVVGLWNVGHQRFMRMNAGESMDVHPDKRPDGTMPASWVWEKFQIVYLDRGEVAFWSPQWKKFVRGQPRNWHLDKSALRYDGTLPAVWDWERFKIQNVGSSDQGRVALWNPKHRRFPRVDGHRLQLSPSPHNRVEAWQRWEQWKIVPAGPAPGRTCVVNRGTEGYWNPIEYVNGGIDFTYETGVTEGRSTERETGWENSVEVSITAGYEFKAFGNEASVEITAANTHTRSASRTVARSFEMSSTTGKTFRFDRGGQVWQFSYTVMDTCGTAVVATTPMVQTNNAHEPPCCLPGDAKVPNRQHGKNVCVAGRPVLPLPGCI